MDSDLSLPTSPTQPLRGILKGLLVLNALTLIAFVAVLASFSRIDHIIQSPALTPAEYLASHPWLPLEVGGLSFIWSEPSSTVIVYGLGLFTVGIGISLTRLGDKPHAGRSHFVRYWGFSLIIWGLGTLFAGTSYQAFFYELKCRDQEFCLWTTWWEVCYLVLTVISVNFMVIAQSHLREDAATKAKMKIFAGVNIWVYVALEIIGLLLGNQFLLSFEMMVIFQLLAFGMMLAQNIREFRRTREPVETDLIKIWLLLAGVMAAYFIYFYAGISEVLWARGIWFNANDVLHVLLMGWMAFIYLKIRKVGK